MRHRACFSSSFLSPIGGIMVFLSTFLVGIAAAELATMPNQRALLTEGEKQSSFEKTNADSEDFSKSAQDGKSVLVVHYQYTLLDAPPMAFFTVENSSDETVDIDFSGGDGATIVTGLAEQRYGVAHVLLPSSEEIGIMVKAPRSGESLHLSLNYRTDSHPGGGVFEMSIPEQKDAWGKPLPR